MIKFTKNVKKILPYNRGHYISYLDDEFNSPIKWYGVSFLLGSEENGLVKYVKIYECLFKNIVSKLDNGSIWILNHDDKDLAWFPNNVDNLTLLRNLFRQNNVPNAYRGALVLTKDDLLKLSKEIITYPYAVNNKESLLYKNLDISHGELSFIIKIYSDFCIDLLSTDKELLKEIINDKLSDNFIVKEYRGSSLWT